MINPSYNGVAKQAGLLAKIIISPAFPRKFSVALSGNTPQYSGGTAPESNWTSLLSTMYTYSSILFSQYNLFFVFSLNPAKRYLHNCIHSRKKLFRQLTIDKIPAKNLDCIIKSDKKRYIFCYNSPKHSNNSHCSSWNGFTKKKNKSTFCNA